MASVGMIENMSDLFTSLPPNILDSMVGLITILKALGVVFILYILFAIINGIVTWLRYKRIKRIEDKMLLMDRKLDLILKKENKNKKVSK
jgi:hypothetical protein